MALFSKIIALCFSLAVLTIAASAREGFVRSRDGKIYEGHLRFESNAVVIVDAEREIWVQVALTNLSEVVFALPALKVVDVSALGTGADLPPYWHSEDVGHVRHAGDARFVSGQFHVRGGG